MATPLRWLAAGLVLLGGAVTGAYVHDRLVAGKAREPIPVARIPEPTVGAGAIPARRPDFTLADLDGRRHPIGEWDGRPLLINFWASWCAPCRREIPLLNRLQAAAPAGGLQVLGIAVDVREDVQKFLRQVPIHYPVLIGEQDGLDAANAFGVQALAFPFSVFVDHTGRVLSLHLGELHEAQAAATLAVLERLDRGELEPDAARAALEAALAALPKAGAATPGS